jgi:hypothetical protein
MNTYRPRLFYVALVAVAICNLGSVCTIGQNPSTSTAAAKSCVGLHCAFVRIVHVTSYGKNGDLKYIIASGKAGTYILSCLTFECQVPVEGKEYEYSELAVTEPGDDRYAFLTGPAVQHGQYHLEVIVPELPTLDVRALIGQCQRADRFATEGDCGRWIFRKQAIEKAPCPDPGAASACKSFQELVRANDPDVMDDLAHQDHVYACFLPGKEDFFEVIFSEPTPFGFGAPSGDETKEGVPSNALTEPGGSEFAYYTNGVGDENKTLHNLGTWIYYPLGEKTDPQSLKRNASSKQAQFKGKNIEIDSDRWALTETYKNQAGTETQHTVTVQLATGRFREQFVLTASGRDTSDTSGRCLIVSSDYF